MEVWILVLTVSSLVVSSQACPTGHFSAVFVITVDQTVEDPHVYIEDPKLDFFKNVLHLQEEEIQHVFEDAMNFFNYTFGLDFSDSTPNEENTRHLGNAKMSPVVLRKDVNLIATSNSWIRNGNTRSRCYHINHGEIEVTFSAETTLYGKYGGDEGKPIGPNEPLLYGFLSIDACEQSPVIIHYHCPTPIRTEPIDGTHVINCYTFNRALGHGRFQGIGIMRPDRDDPEQLHLMYRAIITFGPGSEQDDPGERKGPVDMEHPHNRE